MIGVCDLNPISKDVNKQVYDDAWMLWGADAQIDICIEEMAELTQAFLKARRADCEG